jgi:hypothetical protein
MRAKWSLICSCVAHRGIVKPYGAVWLSVLIIVVFIPYVGSCPAPAVDLTPTATVTLTPSTTPTSTIAPAPTRRPDGLTPDEAATLDSLTLVNGFPLYTMQYVGDYAERLQRTDALPTGLGQSSEGLPAWGCSLFAALGDEQNMQYGRNFDWEHSPALLLFTDPSDGYASVSLVDLAYFASASTDWMSLLNLPLAEREPLLWAPFIPFDGMNSEGLVIGMAAVPDSEPPYDPGKPDVASVTMMRMLLDHAGAVEEAIALMGQYNILWSGGPALHFLIADAGGRAALVEFRDGHILVIENGEPWGLATNFLVSAAGSHPEGECWRYDLMEDVLRRTGGALTALNAMDMLESVSVEGTQWSAVYEINKRAVTIVMGRDYDHPFRVEYGLLAW